MKKMNLIDYIIDNESSNDLAYLVLNISNQPHFTKKYFNKHILQKSNSVYSINYVMQYISYPDENKRHPIIQTACFSCKHSGNASHHNLKEIGKKQVALLNQNASDLSFKKKTLVTNSHLTASAKALAHSDHIHVIEREKLEHKIAKYFTRKELIYLKKHTGKYTPRTKATFKAHNNPKTKSQIIDKPIHTIKKNEQGKVISEIIIKRIIKYK